MAWDSECSRLEVGTDAITGLEDHGISGDQVAGADDPADAVSNHTDPGRQEIREPVGGAVARYSWAKANEPLQMITITMAIASSGIPPMPASRAATQA